MKNVRLKVTEIYQSVQGESSLVGIPCTFIRLTGCPLRCRWCDTVYSFQGGLEKSMMEIIEEVEKWTPRSVELTGGEPLAQEGTTLLAEELLARGFRVLIETSGSEPIDTLPKEVHVVMDIKCPGSGMESHNLLSNLDHLKTSDDLKFVVSSKSDFDWSVDFVRKHALTGKVNVLASPAWGLVDPKDLVSWILDSEVPFRLNLQIHKYVWGPRVKGV